MTRCHAKPLGNNPTTLDRCGSSGQEMEWHVANAMIKIPIVGCTRVRILRVGWGVNESRCGGML